MGRLSRSTRGNAGRFPARGPVGQGTDAMTRVSRKIVVAIVFGIVGGVIVAENGLGQDEKADTDVRFLWAFGAMVGPDGSRQLVAVDRDRSLQTGDRLKFMIAPRTSCFIYLFHTSDADALTLLYPQQFQNNTRASDAAIFVPPDNLWFTLDEEIGTEKFYLLASRERLQQIESLYKRLVTLKKREDRQATTAAIIDAIRTLRRRHLRNTGPVERPIRLGGSFRGLDDDARLRGSDLSTIAVEISAPNFYSRTFTIDHR